MNVPTQALAPFDLVPGPRPEQATAYARARRHSGYVRLLKWAIPGGAAVASALVLAATMFSPFGRAEVTVGPVSVSGTKVAMEGPRLTGFKKDARPYEVTATAAYQDIRKPTVIELKDMKARLVLDETGAAARLVSRAGLFDTQKEHLDLSGDIQITTDKGEEAVLRSAAVDFKGGTISSREKVRVSTASGTIEAEGLHVSDNGKTISFTGGVKAVLVREAAGKREPAPARLTEAEPGLRR